jgi:hypothetical protein
LEGEGKGENTRIPTKKNLKANFTTGEP